MPNLFCIHLISVTFMLAVFTYSKLLYYLIPFHLFPVAQYFAMHQFIWIGYTMKYMTSANNTWLLRRFMSLSTKSVLEILTQGRNNALLRTSGLGPELDAWDVTPSTPLPVNCKLMRVMIVHIKPFHKCCSKSSFHKNYWWK